MVEEQEKGGEGGDVKIEQPAWGFGAHNLTTGPYRYPTSKFLNMREDFCLYCKCMLWTLDQEFFINQYQLTPS